jgi:hypothetical protein
VINLLLPLLILAGYPLFLLFFFKSNAGMLFLATCAGLVLLGTLDPTVVTTAGAIVPGEGEAYVRLSVVVFTMTFTAMIYQKTIKSAQLPVHVVQILLLAAMLLLLLPSATGISWLVGMLDSQVWQQADDFKTLIVSAGFSLSLVLVLLHNKHHSKKGKHH